MLVGVTAIVLNVCMFLPAIFRSASLAVYRLLVVVEVVVVVLLTCLCSYVVL